MTTRMLIDATHEEETRVVVLRGNRLEEFDLESSTKQQIKGNIYLAKVTRVEPSLQAAFVEYGGNRHGFLAFNEIHPDYYQIPVEDRIALLEEEAAHVAKDLEDEESELSETANDDAADDATVTSGEGDDSEIEAVEPSEAANDDDGEIVASEEETSEAANVSEDGEVVEAVEIVGDNDEGDDNGAEDDTSADAEVMEEARRRRSRPRRNYKIQEVIKKRQILLVQVVKEERGNKGAALTTYLSLAGRYCVLMPNTARGGGISRKITNQTARRKLKKTLTDLQVPEGMGVIVRTAGQARTKSEIRRDFDYLFRVWDKVRDLTLESSAPALVYEEANLIKRAIRDLYTKDVNEVLVEGEDGYRLAKDFMRMLMPSHAKKVQPYKDRAPLFHRYQIHQQLDSMHSNTVTLRSGGYLVISPTEALVAVDVNSGRSTKGYNVEDTAVKTNLEAAEELARQLRLRDLAGLIVIDFIDMDEGRNNRAVERKLRDSLKSDRARVQVGRISSFGLMEMSRQRLRPSLQEAISITCPHCEGSGLLRSIESATLQVLRAIEEEGVKGRSAEVTVTAPTDVALFILNQKRSVVTEIEERYGFVVLVLGDDKMILPNFNIEGTLQRDQAEPLIEFTPETVETPEEDAEGGKRKRRRRRRKKRDDRSDQDQSQAADGEAAEAVAADDAETTADSEEEQPKRRRRRRKKADKPADSDAQSAEVAEDNDASAAPVSGEDDEGEEKPRRRRRGRRGGRKRRDEGTGAAKAEDAQPEVTVEISADEGAADDANDAGLGTAPAAPIEVTVEAAVPEAEAKPTLEPVTTTPEPAVEAVLEQPTAPKKRGWWQRGLGG